MLNNAFKLAPNDFYPWYFSGIIYEKLKTPEKAQEHLEKAIELAQFPYQKGIANRHLQNVARISGDYAAQENLLKENISNDPNSPHRYGNYATFLMYRERYQEAVVYWKKAIEKGSYPHAEKQLKKSMRLLDEQNKQ